MSQHELLHDMTLSSKVDLLVGFLELSLESTDFDGDQSLMHLIVFFLVKIQLKTLQQAAKITPGKMPFEDKTCLVVSTAWISLYKLGSCLSSWAQESVMYNSHAVGVNYQDMHLWHFYKLIECQSGCPPNQGTLVKIAKIKKIAYVCHACR